MNKKRRAYQRSGKFSEASVLHFSFIYRNKSYELSFLSPRRWKIKNEMGGFKVISKPQSIISTLYLLKTHMNWGGYWSRFQRATENLCEVKKKKSLQGTYNSHNPQLTWTSAQSEAALKVRRDASTYINHERSHHKKNSNAHKRHSACQCVSIFFSSASSQRLPSDFSSHFSLVFHDSSILSFCLFQAIQ